MLLVNDEQLDLRNTKDERVRFFLDEREKIQALKDYVVVRKIKSPAKLMKDDKGRLLREPYTTIPCKCVINSVRGTEEWRWAETKKTRNTKSGSFPYYEPNHFVLNDEIFMNPMTDTEKIFYLTRIMNVLTCGCEVYDPVAEARSRNQAIGGDELAARYMLYMSKDVTEDRIRVIARAWGLEDAEDCNIEILKSKLWDTVEIGEKRQNEGGRGFRNFVNDFQNIEKTEMRAILYKAIHENVIEFSALQKAWIFKNTQEVIVRVPQERIPRKFELLMEYFASHDEVYQNLHIDMAGKPPKPEYSIADIELMDDMVKVRTAAKDLGVTLAFNIGIDTAKKKIVEVLKES